MELLEHFIITYPTPLKLHTRYIIKYLLMMKPLCIQMAMITLKCTILFKITRLMEKWSCRIPRT
jgi:hypothetical protein